MSVYTKILSLINGASRTVDLSIPGNTLGVSAIQMDGSTSGSVTLTAAATTSPYSLIYPSAQGSASSVLQNDGVGNLSWGTISTVSTISNVFTAGESFAANTSFVVRWAIESLGETADEVRKADYTTTSNDEFWSLGIAFSPTAVSAGQNITVYSFGSYALGSGDTPFSSASIGDPVWLTTDGSFSVTSPSGSMEADFKVGIVMTTTNIWLDGQLLGVGGGGGPTEIPLSVAEGGTGNTAFTPYGVVVGGTTSTGDLQQVGGLGTSGYVLTSNGPSALPSWQVGGTALVFADSLVNTSGTVTLVNDTATPGNTKYYGTNGSGTLGYYSIPATGVSSVALFDGSTSPIYTISGSPVTSSGTLTFTLGGQSVNTVFAGPSSGSAAQPTFRALVAGDVPTLNQNTTGTAANITATTNTTLTTLSALSLPGSQVSGNIPGNAANVTATSNATLTTLSALSLPTSQLSGTVSLTTQASGTLQAAQEPAHTGDVTNTAGSLALSLVATSNATLTTLSALTTASSLASVGTITSGTWNGTTIALTHGGTGQTSASAAFAALSPMTTAGDIIYENGTPTPARLPIGTSNQVLTVVGGFPTWNSTTVGANVALSNLSVTSINAALVPNADNSLAIGSAADGWSTVYAYILKQGSGSSINLNTAKIYDSASELSVDYGNRILYDSSGTTAQMSWSATGVTVDKALLLNGSTSGAITQMASATTTSYAVTWPAAQASGTQVLQNNGSGVLSWATSATGTVTSVALADSTGLFTISGSPVTSSGTLTLASLNSQSANTFFAGPNGSSGTPTFRAILSADIPTLNQNTTGTAANITATSNATLTTLSALTTASSLASVGTISSGTWAGTTIAINHGGTGQTTAASAFNALNPMTTTGDTIYESATGVASRLAVGSTGQVLTVVSGVPSWATPTTGTVSSVAFADASTTPIYTISGSPVTSSGTLTQTLTTQAANTVFAGPTSSTAQPSFRALVAGDIPTLNQNTTGTAANVTATSNATLTTLSALTTASSLSSVGTITSGTWTGTTIAIANGGTGQVTKAAAYNALSPMTTTGDLEYESATGVASRLAIGSTGNVLTVVSGVPAWTAPAASGTVTSVSVVSANGLAGTVATSTTTPAITLSTTVTGVLQGNGTAISAATTTGTGNVVLATGPTLTLTNATGLPLTTGVTGSLPIANGGTSGTTQATALSALGIRSGTVAISSGQTSATITYSSTLGSTSYSLVCTLLNTTDSLPQFQPVTISSLSATGATVSWNGPTGSANYVLHYQAIINV